MTTATNRFGLMWSWIAKHFGGIRPRVDPGRVGITFVDVLFALVVGYALEPLRTWWKISLEGRAHLSVAIVLTLLSWIGYHNSANRPTFVIGFVNLPLFIFVLDVSMVVTYAFAVFTAETLHGDSSAAAATILPEAWAVFISFVLYWLWDRANYELKQHSQYEDAWNEAVKAGILKPHETFPKDMEYRRYVTIWCLRLSVVALFAAYVFQLSYRRLSSVTVVAFDAILILLLIGYRIAKDWTDERLKAWSRNVAAP